MKVFKIVLISLSVLLVVACAGLVIFIKTFDVMRFKPQIIEQANKALGRQLDFERASLGISLRQGITLTIKNLSITEDPAFGKTDFLVIKSVSVGVDVLKFVTRREISAPDIIIDSASVIVIRDKAGAINVQTIALAAQQQPPSGTAASVSPAAALPALMIDSLQGRNNTVVFIDRTLEPAMELRVSRLDFSVRDFSLTKPFAFTVEAAAFSGAQNIKIEGRAQLDLKTGAITVKDVVASTNLAQLSLDAIRQAFPMAKDAPLPTALKGTLALSVPSLTAGPQGLGALSADVSLKGGQLQMKELASAVSDIAADLNVTQDAVNAKKITARLAGGTVEASGTLKDYLAQQQYSFVIDSKNVNLAELIDQKTSPVQTEGTFAAQMQVRGAGFTPEALKSSLSGAATLSLIKGRLANINVLRTVLDKISVLPGLLQSFEAGLPDRWKEKLTQKGTALSDIRLPVTIENGQLVFKDAVVGADEFVFTGTGRAGLEGDFSVEGAFVIPQDLSQAMAAQVDTLQYLLNDRKQIYLPLKVSGRTGAAPVFSVDAEYIARQLLKTQAKQQIFQAIDKALGNKEEQSAQPEGQGQPPQNDTQTQKPSTEEAVKDILKGIFK